MTRQRLPPHRFGLLLRAVGLTAGLVIATAATARQPGSDPPSSPPAETAAETVIVELEPLPAVDLEGLETAVAESLREARNGAMAELSAPDVDAAGAAEVFGRLGLYYDAYGLAAAAAVAYGNAARLVPEDFRWPYALGYLHHRESRLDLAIAGYRAALERRPDFVPALVRLGQVLLERHELVAAEELARRALALASDEPAARALAGEIALAGQRWDQAITDLEAVLAEVPEADRLHYPLALAYRGRGDATRARHHLERRGVVGLAPTDPLAAQLEAVAGGERVHILRGSRAFRAGQYDDAVLAFSAAVDANPASVTARINLAAALEARGDDEEALAQLQIAERSAPANTTLLYNLGVTLAARGELEAAAARLAQVVAARPTDAQAWLRLAHVEQRRERPEAAAAAARQAAAAAPADVEIQAAAAELLASAGQRLEGLERLEALRRSLVGEARLEIALARVLIGAEATTAELQRALDLASAVFAGARTPDAAVTAAAAAAALGRCDEAAAWQRRAIESLAEAASRPRLEETLRHYETVRPCSLL